MFRAGLLLIIRRYYYSVYIQQLVYVMPLCRLGVCRVGMELPDPVNSQST
jgi:hypothetical protein